MHFKKTPMGVAGQVFDGRCRSYDPGHSPHYIQLRKACESSQENAEIIGIELPSTLFLSMRGITAVFFNHHPGTILDLIEIHQDCELSWVEEFGVLVLETKQSGSFAFNLTRKALGACLP